MDWQKLDIWPRGKAGFDKDELPEAVKEMAIIAGGTEDPGTGTTYGYARVNREGKEPQ